MNHSWDNKPDRASLAEGHALAAEKREPRISADPVQASEECFLELAVPLPKAQKKGWETLDI